MIELPFEMMFYFTLLVKNFEGLKKINPFQEQDWRLQEVAMMETLQMMHMPSIFSQYDGLCDSLIPHMGR